VENVNSGEKNSDVALKGKNSFVFTFFDKLFSTRKFWETFITRNATRNRRTITHLNQFQETLGTRKNQFPEKRSAGKNQLFFFLLMFLTFSEIQAD
jgi:hypothetical protein